MDLTKKLNKGDTVWIKGTVEDINPIAVDVEDDYTLTFGNDGKYLPSDNSRCIFLDSEITCKPIEPKTWHYAIMKSDSGTIFNTGLCETTNALECLLEDTCGDAIVLERRTYTEEQ